MRSCSKCGIAKPAAGFYKQPASRPTADGLTYWCRSCYAENYAANRERQIASSHRARIRRHYGLTVEEYEELIGRGCSVCGSHDRVVLDHCHATERVRAPLCTGCNVALGATGDDPERLEALARFLREQDFVTVIDPQPRVLPRIGPTDDELRSLYVDEQKTGAEIAAVFDVTQPFIHKRLVEAGIPRRKRGPRPKTAA